MPTTYTVRPGDHISAIAAKFGFRRYKTIWDYSENAELAKKRKNPHVLHPGDQVVIPDMDVKQFGVPTGQRHVFVVARTALMLRITVRDFDSLPVANADCELTVDGTLYLLTSDAEGRIETAVPATAESGVLKLSDLGLEVPVKIGHLDPEDEASGWQARLINLGYYHGSVGENDPAEIRHALEEFQCDHSLPITGEADQTTRTKLKQVHGA